MGDAAVQIDLVGLLGLHEQFFRTVTFLGWEDLVGFGCGDGEWAGYGEEFVFFDEAGDVLDL